MIDNLKIKKERVIFVYLLLICLFSIGYFLLQIFVDSRYFDAIFIRDFYDGFMDHFNSLKNAKFDPYEDMFSNYPAMACLIYRVFFAMIPQELREGTSFDLRMAQYAMVPFVIYSIVIFWFMQMVTRGRCELEEKSKTVLSLVMLLCAPMLFAIERGNIIILSFVLTMFFSFFYESDNKILKELAFIALAIAAAIKIYPAIYGFLLLKRKKLKEIIRLVLYGIIAFVLPFFYYDGFKSLKIMIEALSYTSNMFVDVGYGINVSLYNIVKTISIIFNAEANDILIYTMYAIIVVLLVSVFLITKKKWQEILSITLLLVFLPKMNYYYVLIFMLIPFVEFLNDCKQKEEKLEIIDYISLSIFFVLMVPWASNIIPIFADYKLVVSYTMLMYYLALLWLVMVLFYELIYKFLKGKSSLIGVSIFVITAISSISIVIMAMIR